MTWKETHERRNDVHDRAGRGHPPETKTSRPKRTEGTKHLDQPAQVGGNLAGRSRTASRLVLGKTAGECERTPRDPGGYRMDLKVKVKSHEAVFLRRRSEEKQMYAAKRTLRRANRSSLEGKARDRRKESGPAAST